MDEYPFSDRRNVLKALAAGSVVSPAGCGGSGNGDGGAGGDGTGEESPDGNETDDDGTDGGDQPPGADVLGGPDDLRSDVTVEALVLDSDQGAGQNVFSPAVVWLEEGATITWENVSGSHSVTAYHPNNDRSNRIPTAAASFNSDVMSEGDTFEHTFDTDGVVNYYCTPHEGLGMKGAISVAPEADNGDTATAVSPETDRGA